MAKVQLSDILIPSVWDPYFLELTAEKSDLIESGIVVRDKNLDVLALGGGNSINMPFYTDLTGSSQELSDSSSLVPGKIGTSQDIARLHMRGDARSVNDLSGALSGTDPLATIAGLIHKWWMRDEQKKVLLPTLKGMFADNTANDTSDLIHTHAAEATADIKAWNDSAPSVMCPEAIIDGQALLGDSQDKFTAIMMHSKCLVDLLKQELIDTERPSGASDAIYRYLGKRVIVDDGCPTRAGTGTGTPTVYQSFLFGEGAIGRGEGMAPVPSELERDALASDTHFVTRRHFILHPRGIKFTSTSVAGSTPTQTEMENAANWDRVYEKKNIRIAMIETN